MFFFFKFASLLSIKQNSTYLFIYYFSSFNSVLYIKIKKIKIKIQPSLEFSNEKFYNYKLFYKLLNVVSDY